MPKGKNKVLERACSVQVPVPPFLLPIAAAQEEKHLKDSQEAVVRMRGSSPLVPLFLFLTFKEEKGRTCTQVPL